MRVVTWRRVGLAAILIGAGYSLWLAWLTRAGAQSDLQRADCILIPGAHSLANGRAGPSLQARIDRAVELWKAGYAPYLLTTGGRGNDGSVESLVARDEAMRQGVPAGAIEGEQQSHTTWENFRYARQIMLRRGWKSCLICTDPFHEPRCLRLASDFGLVGYAAPTFSGPAWTQRSVWLYESTRELAAWMKYEWGRLDPTQRAKQAEGIGPAT